jgi:hypothetical protein
MMARDLAPCEKPDERHVSQRFADDLQLGMWRTEVRATASRAAHV